MYKGSTHLEDARVRLSALFIGTVFFRYAMESADERNHFAEPGKAEQEARRLEGIYFQHGYNGLPTCVKKWVLDVLDRPQAA